MASRLKKTTLGATLVASLLVVGLLAQRRLTMEVPTNLGFRDGRLAECPPTPNCVSSRAEDERHRVEPLALDGDVGAAMARLKEILERMPRTRVVDATDTYLHAEATSRVWGYVDDLELLAVPGAHEIHLRSASRTGTSDLGVNRRRVRALAAAWGRPAAR
jgi:uncharacterized protein (DUF1499 family)